MLDTLLTIVLSAVIILASVVPYLIRRRRREVHALKRFAELEMIGLHKTVGMHPHIDVTNCIGCGACVTVCPEGDVLGIIEGKAAIIHGAKCVGHGLCADACPVGAIELLMAAPGRSAELPLLNEHRETSVPGLYIVGELGGIGLIRNAVEQGKAVIGRIVATREPHRAQYDVAIVGAGPAGLTAGLAATAAGLSYIIFEQGTLGGAILHYPRAKVVMTAPVILPIWGKLKLTEVQKEELVQLWHAIVERASLVIQENEKVTSVVRQGGYFVVTTPQQSVTAARVVLGLGRRGTPRKLGVPGEERPNVMYRLIDASTYTKSRVLVVGGGNSAVEAAIGLSIQPGNTVALSYRKGIFTRITERNRKNLDERVTAKGITLLLNSEVRAIERGEVRLSTVEGDVSVPADHIFIFIGGELPFTFLQKAGVQMQQQLVTGLD